MFWWCKQSHCRNPPSKKLGIPGEGWSSKYFLPSLLPPISAGVPASQGGGDPCQAGWLRMEPLPPLMKRSPPPPEPITKIRPVTTQGGQCKRCSLPWGRDIFNLALFLVKRWSVCPQNWQGESTVRIIALHVLGSIVPKRIKKSQKQF